MCKASENPTTTAVSIALVTLAGVGIYFSKDFTHSAKPSLTEVPAVPTAVVPAAVQSVAPEVTPEVTPAVTAASPASAVVPASPTASHNDDMDDVVDDMDDDADDDDLFVDVQSLPSSPIVETPPSN